MYPVDFPIRLEIAKNKREDVNCISAAHYLLRINDEEEYIMTSFTSPSYIRMRFRKVGTLTAGQQLFLPDKAVAFGITDPDYDSYWHMGIINPFNRAELIQRPAYNTPIEVTTIDKVFTTYYRPDIKVDFLTPNPQWRAFQ